MKAATIIRHINDSDLSREDLKRIASVVVMTGNQLDTLAVYDYAPGELVKFMSRRGVAIHGTIVRRNRKTLSVQAKSGAMWRVSPNLIERCDEAEIAEEAKLESQL